MPKFEEVAITYQTPYRVVGFILLFASLLALPAVFGASGVGRWVALGMFLLLAVPGSLLALQKFRKRWSPERGCLLHERRFVWGQWRSKPVSVQEFAEVEILPTTGAERAGIQTANTGVMVRVRHSADSRNNYPGERSWVLWTNTSLKDAHEEAYRLAEEAANGLRLPLRDSLTERGFEGLRPTDG